MPRLPRFIHGRWRTLISLQRELTPLVKLVILIPVLYCLLNVFTMTEVLNGDTNALRSVEPQTNNDIPLKPITNNDQARGSRRSVWLAPKLYHENNGCDLSAVVQRFNPDELEINCGNIDQLETGEFLGSGLWREVYMSTWKGRKVAVKKVKETLLSHPGAMTRQVKEAAVEFAIRHESNIVELIGWCNSTVVVDYIADELFTLLYQSGKPISVRWALELARDAARGLSQLHNIPGGPIAHGDIKADQFFLDKNNVVRLNDFNYASYAGTRVADGVKTSETCTFQIKTQRSRWNSPERLMDLGMDEKDDIYSLSILLWSMRARKMPFRGLTPKELIEQIPKGLRPPISAMSDYPKAMQDLIIRGWDNDPKKRPTASQMLQEIENILLHF